MKKISYKIFTGIKNFLPKILKIYNKEDKYKIIEIFNCIKLPIEYKSYRKLYKEAAQIRENQKIVLKKLRKEFGTRPIKVAFIICENQKWNTSSLYKMFEESPYFEPYVVVSLLYRIHKGLAKKKTSFQENLEFFKKLNLNIIVGYNEEKKEYIDLEQYHFDIIFYSSPWSREFSKNQWIQKTSKNSLLCYIPYAIAEASSSMIQNKLFFESVFKFFVADKKVINEYKKKIIKKNQNSITETGHTKLDVYFEPAKKLDIDKPIVIYAPHFTIGNRFFSTGTFDWSGKFLLEYAQSHQEYHWIFKPHPSLKSEFIRTGFMTEEDIENYYNEWSKIGTLYEKGNYFDLFKNSKCMITDCASFLLEYYPTQKPVIRLLSKTYTYNNALTEMIAKRYYVARNLKQLKNNLNLILEKHQDPLKKYRMKYLDLFQPKRESAAKEIFNILVNELSQPEENVSESPVKLVRGYCK